VGSSQSSYVPGSGVPDFIQNEIDAQQASEITNSEAAVPYFEDLMGEYGVPGE